MLVRYNKSRRGPPRDVIIRGPSHQPSAYGAGLSSDNRIQSHTIHGYGTLSSDGAGKLAAAISMDPSALASTDWADFSSTFDEFRVTGCRIRLASLLQNSITSVNNLMFVAFDNDSATAPTSYTQVQQYSTAVPLCSIFQHNAGKLFRKSWWRPTAGSETTIPWVDVATPSGSAGSIIFYSDTLTISTGYLVYAVELFVELRGRR